MRLPAFLRPLPVLLALVTPVLAAVVFDDPLLENGEPKVRPTFPTGKSLLFPISAYDEAGGQLSYTVTSSNLKVFVRVKTGNPLMKFVIHHDDDTASGDTSFDQTAVFQLFRDIAPETAGYIGGFAQGGFYDTGNGSKIFRIADFGPVAGQAQDSFIFQGGSNTGDGTGDIGYSYDNEFHPSAMFTGSGQLAMANSGYSSYKRGSNGSQFFITDGNTRQLDFKHTIFAQLTHGFGVLKKMREVTKANTSGDSAPAAALTITSSSTLQQYVDADGHAYTDAVLVLAANAPGTSLITVTATNPQGEKKVQTFTVTVVDDPKSLNTRPFVTALPDGVIPANVRTNLGFRMYDMERDYTPATLTMVNNGSTTNPNGVAYLYPGQQDLFGIPTSPYSFVGLGYVSINGNQTYLNSTGGFSIGPYTGPLYPTVSITQLDPLYRGGIDGFARDIDNSTGSTIGVGELDVQGEVADFTASPGSTPAAPYVVARYRDTDPKGKASDATASINWGDGTALAVGAVAFDTLKPATTRFQVSGSHVYTRAGTYTVTTTITSAKGLKRLIRSTAVVTGNTLKATGETIVLAGPTLANPVLCTFVDPGTTTPATGYVATVDWGDGVVAKGTVRSGGVGKFSVVGVHTYKDSERYSVSVRIHKSGTPAEQDSIAWSSVTLTAAFGVQHLPPFNMAHIVGGLTGVPTILTNPDSVLKPIKETVGTGATAQTYLNYQVQLVNTGNIPSKPGKLRFYLSLDKTLNLTATEGNPADIPLKIVGLRTNEFFLPAMQSGQVIKYYFQKSIYADYRLAPPVGENGTGYNLLVQIDYTDPLADHMPIDKLAIDGKINGIKVDKTVVTTSEAGGSATINLTLDKAPTANVTVPVAVDGSGTTEGVLDTPSVVFTPSDWQTPHPVTVTGISDSNASTGVDGTKTYYILIGRSVSTDPLYSGMEGPPVLVSNTDRDGNLKLTANTTSYTLSESQAVGANNTKNISFTVSRAPASAVDVKISVSDTNSGEIVVAGGTDDSTDPAAKHLIIPAGGTAPFFKSFTLKSKDDHLRAGPKLYTVTFEVTSPDKQFDGIKLPSLSITNTDDGDTTGTTTP